MISHQPLPCQWAQVAAPHVHFQPPMFQKSPFPHPHFFSIPGGGGGGCQPLPPSSFLLPRPQGSANIATAAFDILHALLASNRLCAPITLRGAPLVP